MDPGTSSARQRQIRDVVPIPRPVSDLAGFFIACCFLYSPLKSTAPVKVQHLKETIMEVLQYQVIKASNGFCIAAYDESIGSFSRLSKEVYQQFDEACTALFTGTWTLA